MKQKKFIVLFAVIMVLVLGVTVFAACNKKPDHQHEYGDWVVTKEATCTEAGSRSKTCDGCGDVVTEELPALGHDYGANDRCTRCGTLNPNHTHTFGDWATEEAATCTADGSRKRTCSVCGEEETEPIDALGHDFVDNYCTRCGAIDPDHDHVWSDWTLDPEKELGAEPTCTEEGYRVRYCTLDGCDETKDQAIPALGHDFDAHGNCTRCDAHVHVYGDWVVTLEQTCTTAGLRKKTCLGCDDVITEVIAPHHFGENGICEVCGLEEGAFSSALAEHDTHTYSYRMGPSDLPTAWNFHTYQSNSATYILDYSSDSLYTFDYKDENLDSFTIVPSMASAMPVDITALIAADPELAEKWQLGTGKYNVTAAEDGDFLVEEEFLYEGEGIVDEDDLYAYNEKYAAYIEAGVLVRVNAEEIYATENRIYRISLKDNLKFDNGDPITADTFVESMALLLNPAAANFRADNVYKSGNLKIFGAEEYVKAGNVTLEDLTTNGSGVGQGEYTGWDNKAANYGLSAAMLDKLYFVTTTSSYVGAWAADWSGRDVDWTYGYLAKNYAGAAEDRDKVLIPCYAEMNGKKLSELLADGAGYEYTYEDEEGNEQEAKLLYKTAIDYLIKFWCTDPDEEFGFFCAQYTWPELDFSEVGFYAEDDYNLVVVLKNAMEDNFYLRYELCTSFFLVHPDLYKSCIKMTDGVYTNDYATSVAKYVGFGPYKLTSYLADSTIVLERNQNWHGYTEAEYVPGTYQANRIVYRKVTENATRLEMFVKGELDSYGLQAEDMKDYIASPYVVYTDSESTWYLAMNPQEANLKTVQEAATPKTAGNAVVKTVLCIDDFRKALSYSIDRKQFNLTLSPTSGVAKALLSAMIVADPDKGTSYRSLDVAKDAILSFWGLADAWGPEVEKDYETRDEAINAITGYDPAGAKELFTAAYNEAVARGYITADQVASGNWEVQIVIGQPSAANFYTKGFEFLSTNWTNAVKDTPFEGHLSFVFSQVLGSTTFGTYLRNGSVDILFGVGYGGSMFDPYSMMDCFTGSLQYDPFTDKTKISLDITYDFGAGVKTYRASLYSWVSECLQGNKIKITEVGEDGELTKNTLEVSAGTSDPSDRRLFILAAAEEAIMNLANIFPLQTDSSASLRCYRISYKTKDYILGMGFGGLQYNTFTMDDDAFEAYVSGQGGTINYK